MISAGGAAPLIGLRVANIGPTDYCTDVGIPKFVSIAMLTAVIYDAAVVLAISARLLALTYAHGGWSQDSDASSSSGGGASSKKSRAILPWVRGFFYGTGLKKFSRTLLQDGQMYYL